MNKSAKIQLIDLEASDAKCVERRRYVNQYYNRTYCSLSSELTDTSQSMRLIKNGKEQKLVDPVVDPFRVALYSTLGKYSK